MTEWQPIETAPKDGTPLDLWVVDRYMRRPQDNKGERVTDAWWGSEHRPPDWGLARDAEWEGWVHVEDGFHHAPIERELSGGSRWASHWQLLPEPPCP